MQIIKDCSPEEIRKELKDLQVDPYGVNIMWPKGVNYIIKLDSLSNISANILKQEMLSFGAEAALARGALTGKSKQTGCLLMGNLAQFRRLIDKLKAQPFGLRNLSEKLENALNNYQSGGFTVLAGKYRINLAKEPKIMGIINLTNDSFSGDGLLGKFNKEEILEYAQRLAEDGADMLDIGGESSRPGAKPLPVKEELKRVIPLIKLLAKKIKIPVSIDTYKPEVAAKALDNGAVMINDISGLRDPKMIPLAAKHKAAVVIMHMKGTPRTMQKQAQYNSVVSEISNFLAERIAKAEDGGIQKQRIIIDPGLGFGKTAEQNLQILKNLSAFKTLGKPILIGASRKSFIGKVLQEEPQNRVFGTIAAVLSAVKNGAGIVRVHDVKAVKQAVKMEEAIEKI